MGLFTSLELNNAANQRTFNTEEEGKTLGETEGQVLHCQIHCVTGTLLAPFTVKVETKKDSCCLIQISNIKNNKVKVYTAVRG